MRPTRDYTSRKLTPELSEISIQSQLTRHGQRKQNEGNHKRNGGGLTRQP